MSVDESYVCKFQKVNLSDKQVKLRRRNKKIRQNKENLRARAKVLGEKERERNITKTQLWVL